MARGLKRTIERIAVRSGLSGAIHRRRLPTTIVLAYHNIVPHGELVAGDVSLHTDQRSFAEHLDYLLDTHDVVPLGDVLDDPASPDPAGRPRAVITFDDAYVGTMTAGLEELAARGIPGTVFVPPGLLEAEAFWWDLLSPGAGAPLSEAIRSHALGPLCGCQNRILEWAATEGLPTATLPEHARPADELTVLHRGRLPGVTLGSHTWSHPNLAAIDTREVAAELDQAASWLQARSPGYLSWLSYPYGAHSDDVVGQARTRHDGAVLISGGLARLRGAHTGGPHRVSRVTIPRGLTLEGLALRVAGLRT